MLGLANLGHRHRHADRQLAPSKGERQTSRASLQLPHNLGYSEEEWKETVNVVGPDHVEAWATQAIVRWKTRGATRKRCGVDIA